MPGYELFNRVNGRQSSLTASNKEKLLEWQIAVSLGAMIRYIDMATIYHSLTTHSVTVTYGQFDTRRAKKNYFIPRKFEVET